MTSAHTKARTAARRRAVFLAVAAVLTGALLGAKLAADRLLAGGQVVDLGVIQLRLTFNSGVAFSIGADLPGWIVLAVPAAITVGVAVYGWRHAPAITRTQLAALAVILAGALANVADRTPDGVVTDYLHTGWWPTFNLPDAFIVCGAAALVLAGWRHDTAANHTANHAGKHDGAGHDRTDGTGGASGDVWGTAPGGDPPTPKGA